MKNKAYIDYDFNNGFFIAEDDILKIDEIIRSRFAKFKNVVHKYQVK
ncbi:MAG: hypothetical protein JXC36_05755 [Candidatus Atribacteria bacterium]|nr:hypothetical protein [Candidatus Atribacteria bacterium]